MCWGGGGLYSPLSFIYRKKICGLVAFADSCRGKKDNNYYYLSNIGVGRRFDLGRGGVTFLFKFFLKYRLIA